MYTLFICLSLLTPFMPCGEKNNPGGDFLSANSRGFFCCAEKRAWLPEGCELKNGFFRSADAVLI